MEIWAKSNGLKLKEHTEHLLMAIEKLPYDKSKIQSIDKEHMKKLLRWSAILHDLGKVSPAFQKRIGNTNYSPSTEGFPYVRHNILSLFFISKEKAAELCRNNESLYATFLSVIAFHHWKIDEKEYLLGINEDLIKASQLLLEKDNGKTLGEVLAEKLREHFDGFKVDGLDVKEFISFDEHIAKHIEQKGSLTSVNILPPYTLYFLPERLGLGRQLKIDLNLWIFLSGFLIRADHFASFAAQKDYEGIALGDVEKVIPETNLKNKFENKFGRDFWQKKAEEFKDKNLILIAPTGIGKTEFAFLWAEGEKFFYTLPLRAATNQIFERACNYFNEKEPSEEDPFINCNVGLLHSDADLYLYEKWESSEKDIDGETPKIIDLSGHFSLPVNICTGDQIFPAGLKYPQYEKVYATLGYSKLIIDEVQAYDPRACAIVVKMIEDIVSLGGKFLLMTATLPVFVKEYLKERGIIKDDNIIDCYDENNKIGLKIKTDSKHKIELRNKDVVEDIDEIMTKAAEEGKRILIVLNTIEKAEAVYKKIKEKIESKEIFLDLLHSRFTLNERKKKEGDLEREFKNPKPPDEKNPKILVATQVVEASLDIDADYIFTEIAPMDSLIQRMGRVMRRIKYYEEYDQPESNVFVYINPTEKNKRFYLESGKGYVYENDILFITLCKLLEWADWKEKNLNEVLEFFINYDEKEKKGKTAKELNQLIKKLTESLSNKRIELLLKEKDKNKIVEEVYDFVKGSEYFKKFHNAISILDSGYVSENKAEAHELFREVFTTSLVKEGKIDEVVLKVTQKLQNNKEITWLWFKKEIIAEYVINDHRRRDHNFTPLWERIRDNISPDEKGKLERYCDGIWVSQKKEEKNSENII